MLSFLLLISHVLDILIFHPSSRVPLLVVIVMLGEKELLKVKKEIENDLVKTELLIFSLETDYLEEVIRTGMIVLNRWAA